MGTLKRWADSQWVGVTRRRWDGAAWQGIGGAAPPPAAAAAGFTVKPYSQTVDAPLMTTPPTITSGQITYTDRAWAGADRVYWDSPNLATPGLHPISAAAYTTGTTYAKQGIQNITGGPADMPMAVDVTHTGAKLGIILIDINGAPRYRVFVDGKPAAAAVTTMTGTTYNQPAKLVLDFGSTATRRVRVELVQCGFWGVDITPGDTLTAPPATAPTLAIYGDSWVEGTMETGDVRLDAMAWLTGRILDAPTYMAGFGGTGYVNGATQTPPRHYGAEGRVTPLTAAAPDVIVVFGTINDNGIVDKTTITTNAAELYSRLATDLPDTKVIVVGPESYNNASNTGAQNIANRDAVKAAALAAANVVGFVDPMAEAWITGTGSTTAPAGNGTADIYHNGANPNHLSKAGNRYYAEKLAAAIAALMPA